MYRCLKLLTVLSLIIGLGSAADAAVSVAEPRIVEGMGAIIQRDQAAARTRAMHDALRKALEQVVAERLDSVVLVESLHELETRLYAQALKYILSYRVLWEYPDTLQKVYRVGVEAEVAVDEVTQEIQALGLTRSREDTGRLLVLIVEHHLGQTHQSVSGRNGGVVAQVLRTQLQAQGFHLVSVEDSPPWDGRDSSALTTGKKVGAALVLVGQATVQKVRGEVAGMSLQALQANVQVQALMTATGVQVALEHAEATAFHADAILGGAQALEKAATEVAARLIPPLQMYQQ
jgi:hypothetical protein